MLENLGLEIKKDSFVKFLEDFVQQLPLVAEIPVHKTIRDLRDVIFGAIEHLAWRHVIGKGQLRVTQTARDLTIMLTSGICGAR